MAGGVTSNPSGITNCRSTCTGTFSNTDITLTASYDKGIGQVTWGGCDIITGDSCTVHLTTDRTVTASLAPSPDRGTAWTGLSTQIDRPRWRQQNCHSKPSYCRIGAPGCCVGGVKLRAQIIWGV